MKLESLYRTTDIHHLSNPLFSPEEACPAELQEILGPALITEAQEEITQWADYAPTPLYPLSTIGRSVGVQAVYYKDEGKRFNPGSFKALGGAYAVQQLLRREVENRLGVEASLSDVRERRYESVAADITVATATDGNHGRSVAWGAARFGCRCVIYIHREVSDGRREAMEAFGARVIRVDGNYDDSVREAQADAAANGWFIVSDTSYPGYTTLPRYVMAGYTLLMREVLDQLPDGQFPSHMILQGGCGGLAASMAGYLWQELGERRPRLVVIEPVQADCLYQSASQRDRVDVHITEDSLMAGLSCGEVSTLAWTMVQPAVHDFVSMNDDLIAPTMRLLARGDDGQRIVAGESAVPGLAALLAASRQSRLWEALGLDSNSRVLLLGTEGATDPLIYRELVGIAPDDVEAG